jgi:hypothetical protein
MPVPAGWSGSSSIGVDARWFEVGWVLSISTPAREIEASIVSFLPSTLVI